MFKRIWLWLTGMMEIRHVATWVDPVTFKKGTRVEVERIPKEEMLSTDPHNVMNKYHVPWLRQTYSMHHLHLNPTVMSYWEPAEEPEEKE